MDLNSNSISIIEKTKTDFEEQMKANMVNETFRTTCMKAIPLKDGELDKINNPEFKNKFSETLSEVSKELVNQFGNVAQFDTGNLFTSMVTSISDSVSLEADYRMNRLIQAIRLGKINQADTVELNTAVYKAFENIHSFESKEVATKFANDMKFVMATEEANDVIERIKNDVKDAIEETEAKNDLVEGTTQEIIDYKTEIAPPDDEYQDPENPDANAEGGDDLGTDDLGGEEDPDTALTDTSDDGMTGEGEDTDQIYEGEDDGTGTEPTSDGTDLDGGDDLGTEGDPDAAGGDDLGGEGDNLSDMGDGTEGGDDLGGDGLNPEGEDGAGEIPGNDNAVGGEDGVVDQGDVGKSVDDPALDTPTPDAGAAPAEPAVSDGNSNQNSGGITININGADLAKAKENLNLFSPRSLAEKRVPLHPQTFNNCKLPTVEELSAECVNAGEGVAAEMKLRMDGLKYATRQANLSEEANTAINEKIDSYGKIIGESLSRAKSFERTLESMGITPQGLIFSTENQLCIARNIINRFLTKRQFVSPTVRPYTSKENVFANAFDIVQLRQYVNSHENVRPAIVDDLFARENLFYHNMVNFNDPDVKEQASAIIDLSQMNFKKAMSPNFITDYKIKSWEINVGDKANKDINEEVVKRVKDKFEKLWLRELNADEMKIIRGAANQEDVTELTPTPYEKFMITMTKECLLSHGSEDPITGAKLTQDEKRNIEWKSRLMTTVYKTAEAFGAFNSDDNSNFEKFTNMVGM